MTLKHPITVWDSTDSIDDGVVMFVQQGETVLVLDDRAIVQNVLSYIKVLSPHGPGYMLTADLWEEDSNDV